MSSGSPQDEPSASDSPANSRLESWKDIAAYLQRDVKTVQRWERERGLPVHRLFGDSSRPSVYAFVAEIDAWREGNSAGAARPSPARKAPVSRWLIPAAGAGIAAAALFAFGGWRFGIEPPSSDWTARPLTSYVGGEEHPAISPDGRAIAFVWRRPPRTDRDLFIQLLGSSEPLQLTDTPGSEYTPAWSPDGKRIAFQRRFDEGHEVLTIPALGGAEELLMRTSSDARSGLSWSADGKTLAVPPPEGADASAIYLFSFDDRSIRPFSRPPGGPKAVFDSHPTFSPDGRYLAFTRFNDGEHKLIVVTRDGKLVHEYATGAREPHAWAADGRSLVFADHRSHAGRLHRIYLSDGRIEPLPFGGDDAMSPAIQGDLLAFTRWHLVTSLRLLRLGPDGAAKAESEPILGSTRTEHSPAFSPDGRSVAFISDRTGHDEVWVGDLNGERVRQLTHFEGLATGSPRWSPDGKWIAFDSAVKTPGNWEVYVVSVAGGEPRRLTHHPAQDQLPSWSRDGEWLYFASTRSGVRRIWKMRIDASGEPMPVTRGTADSESAQAADGRLFYSQLPIGELRALSPGSGDLEVLEGLGNLGPSRYWALSDTALFVVPTDGRPSTDGPFPIRRFDLATGKVTTVGQIARQLITGPSGLAVAPAESSLVYATIDVNDMDIMVVEGFH